MINKEKYYYTIKNKKEFLKYKKNRIRDGVKELYDIMILKSIIKKLCPFKINSKAFKFQV